MMIMTSRRLILTILNLTNIDRKTLRLAEHLLAGFDIHCWTIKYYYFILMFLTKYACLASAIV